MSLTQAPQQTVHELARTLAATSDDTARVRLAASADTPPEILFYLANDSAVTVRAAVAMNEATPVRAAHLLARDEDERVRVLIARKLGFLAAGLSEREEERVRRETMNALTALASDEAVRVRAALADVLKDMPDAPRTLILALAQDPAVMVSDPVVRLSPLLTTQDLMALVAPPATEQVAISVARRPGLDAEVCDAVAATASVGAIGAMLLNKSAAIRESTLDALVAQASSRREWHEPMVRRPALSARSMRKLAEIVTDNLLAVLAARNDIDPALLPDLRRRLRPAEETKRPSLAGEVWGDVGTGTALAPASREVGETRLMEAVQRGEVRTASALLALAAGVQLSVVNRAVSLRSAKGLVSLLWKAGFAMAAAGPVQLLLARLAPHEVLDADADGGYPLSPEEMRWQLDFLSRGGR